MTKDRIARLLTEPLPPGVKAEWPEYEAFAEVSQTFLASYSRLLADGLSPEIIASAMLGATVNFHEMFDMLADLPELLRAVADRIESAPS